MTIRAPLFTRYSPVSSIVATMGWTHPAIIGGGAKPVGQNLVEPVRFIADRWVAINSQWYLELSNSNLFLKSTPVSAIRAELPLTYRFSPSFVVGSPTTLFPPVVSGSQPPGDQLGWQPPVTILPKTSAFWMLGSPETLFPPPIAIIPPGQQAVFGFMPSASSFVATQTQGSTGNNELPVLFPVPSFIGSEYIYYAHHKGIR